MSLTFDVAYGIMFSWTHAERDNLPRMFCLAVPDITAGGVTAGNRFLQGGARTVMQERVQMIDYA